SGTLHVTKSYAIGQPYNGVVPLMTGEIAEDVAFYLANSEQIPSVVALGVLMGPEGVRAAGGVMAQVLPGADSGAVDRLEERARSLRPAARSISEGADAWGLLAMLAGEEALRSKHELALRFACPCTLERVERALVGLGEETLVEMAASGESTEAFCDFCRERYLIEPSAIARLVRER
ncbi:MAG TPA: Hsp33 family molecular chaperone HslO, partial [Candidatus Dormibacteraeota bacterium]|nr:Hsp33 family molecular chaperone HslO [Candidatus Dormibacteraeota bacterium]